MACQNVNDGANDTRGPRAADWSPGGHSPTGGAVAADVRTLATLGNETRYEALRFVAKAEVAVGVCELEPALGSSQSADGRAPSRLFAAGLVERRTGGRWRYHTATRRVRRLIRFLDEMRTATRTDE